VADDTLPSVSGINWGDAPTWGAVFVGAVAGTAALIQLRQQGNVFKGEVERNKRRDELLDGQLRELERRETSRRREQAERIDVTWNDMAERPGKSLVVVINGSHRPVREVTCTLYDAPEGEPFEVEYAIELLPASFPGGGFVFREMPGRREWMIGALRGGGRAGFQFSKLKADYPYGHVEIEFVDDAGYSWSLTSDLSLSPV
jgi:hypothetical protein